MSFFLWKSGENVDMFAQNNFYIPSLGWKKVIKSLPNRKYLKFDWKLTEIFLRIFLRKMWDYMSK